MPGLGAAFGRWFSLGLHVAKGGRSEAERAGETLPDALFALGTSLASMAPSPRRSSRTDANALPSASSTFWAVMILVGLLIAYCTRLTSCIRKQPGENVLKTLIHGKKKREKPCFL